MKKLIFIFFVIASGLLEAQTFFVGDTSCNYIRLDTNIRTINLYIFGSWSSSKSYGIDCDQDFIDDIIFTKNSSGFNGGSGSWTTTKLNCTSPNSVEFAYKSGTVSCPAGPANPIDSLVPGTLLNASLSWSPTITNSFLYDTYYTMGNTSGCGYFQPTFNPFIYSLRIYMGFRKILVGDTIYGWILLRSRTPQSSYGPQQSPYEMLAMAYKHTLGNNTVTPVFTSTVSDVCIGGSLSLTGNPIGGVFNGAGVSGNNFNSAYTGTGVHNVFYSNGCALPAIKSITVHSLPVISFSNTQQSTCLGNSLALTASPPGGNFTGPGVSANVFTSSVTGSTMVNYNYTDVFGCSNTSTVSISTVTAPVLYVASTSTLSCPGESVTLSVNGASSYTWSTGAQSSSIVITPTSPTVYTVTGSFSSGSCPLSSATFTQAAGNPPVTASGPTVYLCPGFSAGLFASGATNYTWSTGATNYYTFTNPTVTTTYSVIGMNPAGCSDTAFCTAYVADLSNINVTSSQTLACAGDPLIIYVSSVFTNINGNPSNIIVQDSATGQNIASVGTPSVMVYPSSSITYKLRIWYSFPSGCYFDAYFHQDVISCVGIKELSSNEMNFKIFPNPNAGEFEIKGIKEKSIIITNELGQLVKTIELNSANNFSSKVTELQSGVYFIGNNSVRQKIVVIK